MMVDLIQDVGRHMVHVKVYGLKTFCFEEIVDSVADAWMRHDEDLHACMARHSKGACWGQYIVHAVYQEACKNIQHSTCTMQCKCN